MQKVFYIDKPKPQKNGCHKQGNIDRRSEPLIDGTWRSCFFQKYPFKEGEK
jgi:hypothetical protein